VKGIQVCSNKGPDPLLRGDNCKNVKMECGHLKIFYITTGPVLIRLGTNHPCWEEIQVCTNEWDCPSPRRGDNCKTVKIHRFLKKKNLSPQPAA
jgi:hypothetical protein